jgi:hypothetical protein
MVITAILTLAGSIAAWGYFNRSQRLLAELDRMSKEVIRLRCEGELKQLRNDSEFPRKKLSVIRLKKEPLGHTELSSARADLARLRGRGLGEAHPEVHRLEDAISRLWR